MKRSGAAKFPDSVTLFKFCQKVLTAQRGTRVNDQEVGAILEFNPSDCSHWKRGEKSIRSVFALAKLSEAMNMEAGLVHDVASGALSLDEAMNEWQESGQFQTATKKALASGADLAAVRAKIDTFVKELHTQADFRQAPLYLPEVLKFFAFITVQPADLIDRLSRILKVKPGHYAIQVKKGDLKPQIRMSMAKDLARVIFEAERGRFPELGSANQDVLEFEELYFVANLLAPKYLLVEELTKLDNKKNVVQELAQTFWVPKSLVGFQLKDMVISGYKAEGLTSEPSTTTEQAM